MALAFLNLKGFHPSNKANQRRLFIAEEREKDRIKRDADAIKEWEAEQELFQNNENNLEHNASQSAESIERLKARKLQLQNESNLVFVKEENKEQNGDTAETVKKKKRSRRRGGQGQTQNAVPKPDHPMSLVHVTELAEKARDEQIQKEFAELSKSASSRRTDKALNFMYTIPPGLKAAMEKEKEEEEKQRMHERFALERQKELDEQLQQVPEQMDSSFYPKPLSFDVSVQPLAAVDPESRSKPKHLIPDAEKFPILKNAPVAGRYTENVKLKHKPFGIELRDVRCTRCGGFGHNNLDRECPMRNVNPLDAKRQQMEDPMANIPQASDSGSNTHATDKEKEASDLLNELTPKERKKLMKKYKELKRKLHKSHDSDESSESESDVEKRKRRKESKKRKREDKEERRSKRIRRDDRDSDRGREEDRSSSSRRRRDEDESEDERRSGRHESSRHDDERYRRERREDRYSHSYDREHDSRRSSREYDERRESRYSDRDYDRRSGDRGKDYRH